VSRRMRRLRAHTMKAAEWRWGGRIPNSNIPALIGMTGIAVRAGNHRGVAKARIILVPLLRGRFRRRGNCRERKK